MANALTTSTRRTAALFVALGAYALIGQTVLLRQFLAVVQGNEMAIGLLWAAWFAGIAIGATLWGRLADRLRRLSFWSATVFLSGAVLPPASLIAIKLLPLIFPVLPGLVPGWSAVAVAALLCSPVGFWIGAVFAYFAALHGRDERIVGRLFVWEAVGSLAAGLFFAFVLVPRVPPSGAIAVAVGVLLLGLAFWNLPRVGGWIGAAGVVLTALFVLGPADDRVEQRLERYRFDAQQTGAQFDEAVQTRYQNAVFARAGQQAQLYGDGGYLDSFPDPFVYRQEAALLLAQQPRAEKVVLLGGGLTGLGAALLAAPHIQQVDVVHLDAQLSREILARLPDEDFRLLAGPRVHWRTMDVRRFVKQRDAAFDLAVIVAPDPSTAWLNRLYTIEFFREVHERLSERGVLALTLTGADNLIGEEVGPYLGSIEYTLRQVFPYVLALPGDTIHLFAAKGEGVLSGEVAQLRERYLSAFDAPPDVPPEVIDQWVVPERIAAMRRELAAYPGRLNRDLRPVSYLAFLRVWDRFSGGGIGGFVKWLNATGDAFWWTLWVIVCLLTALVPLPGARNGARRRYALTAVATSGYVGMAAVIVASIAFQSLFGQMYQKIALLIAAYMGGLAAGGAWATRRAHRTGADPLNVLLVGDAALAGVGLLMTIFLWWIGDRAGALSQILLVLLVAATGTAAGTAFPTAAALLAHGGVGAGRRAGIVDALDHLAAMIGAATVGVVLLPAIGLPGVCLLWIALKSAGLAGGLIVKKGRGNVT
ncbi:MAG TPA: hypothetical protein PKW95_12015 [bacterium]|nr:hypothetical protein [bacterium]